MLTSQYRYVALTSTAMSAGEIADRHVGIRVTGLPSRFALGLVDP
jgi:hypothetical protein